MILDVPIKVGNSVIQANTFNDGTTIATVADMGDMLFRGNVDETDIGRLHAGMPVVLTIGAMQGTVLQATLEYISPKAADVNGIIMFEVKAAAKIPESVFVRAGYSANASIVTDSREGVLTLPESTIQFEEGKPCVYILTSPEESPEQTFEKRDVTLGLSDGVNIEIVSGVTENGQSPQPPTTVHLNPCHHEIRNSFHRTAARGQHGAGPNSDSDILKQALGAWMTASDTPTNITYRSSNRRCKSNSAPSNSTPAPQPARPRCQPRYELQLGRSLISNNTYADNNQVSGSLGVSASLRLHGRTHQPRNRSGQAEPESRGPGPGPDS